MPPTGRALQDAGTGQQIQFALERALACPGQADELPEVERFVRPREQPAQDELARPPEQHAPQLPGWAGNAPAVRTHIRYNCTYFEYANQIVFEAYCADISVPPFRYWLNQSVMYSCLRMKFDGIDPVPWYSLLNRSSVVGTPSVRSA